MPDTVAFGRRIPLESVRHGFSISFIAMNAVVVGSLVMLLDTNLGFVRVPFEAISAFGTVGLSTGITPALPNPSRYVLVALMFLGRVGPYTLAVAFALRQRPLKVPACRGGPPSLARKRQILSSLGLGRFGSAVATTPSHLDCEVACADTDERRVQRVAPLVTQAMQLDTTDRDALTQIGLSDFDVAVVAIGADIEASILTTANLWSSAAATSLRRP